jgi:hypothetical protein
VHAAVHASESSVFPSSHSSPGSRSPFPQGRTPPVVESEVVGSDVVDVEEESVALARVADVSSAGDSVPPVESEGPRVGDELAVIPIVSTVSDAAAVDDDGIESEVESPPSAEAGPHAESAAAPRTNAKWPGSRITCTASRLPI